MVGAEVGVCISAVTSGVGWVTVGTGLAVDVGGLDNGLDTGVGVAEVGCVPGGTVTTWAVPVGALTKMLVRPGSGLAQPTISVIRARITTANGYPCLMLNGLL